MKKNNTNIEQIIRELKEFEAMKKELQTEIDELKEQAITYLEEEGIDEYAGDAGKITYREILSNRFNTSAFRKMYADLYDSYVSITKNYRFTLN